jgi:tRNA (adenine37-N6)-methyltransferase
MSKQEYIVNSIGKVKAKPEKGEFSIEIQEKYRPGLKELEKYSHVNVFWWIDKNDNEKSRNVMQTEDLPPFYGEDAPSMGVFATRSEFRPNPIGLTTVQILKIDHKKGIITVPYIDAFDQTPIIDLKPYIMMTDLIKSAKYPDYLIHWPACNEDAMEWWAKQGYS